MLKQTILVDSLWEFICVRLQQCVSAIKYKSKISFKLMAMAKLRRKSVISILASSVKCGQEIVHEADGEDEEEAINAVAQAFKESLKND